MHTTRNRTNMFSRNDYPQHSQDQRHIERVPGKSIAQGIGSQITAAGNNAAAMTATAFLTIAIVAISGRSIGFGSQTDPLRFMADPHASNTRVIGLRSSTPGLNFGRMTGTTTMTSTSLTETTATICSTAGIPAPELRSVSRCDQIECAIP